MALALTRGSPTCRPPRSEKKKGECHDEAREDWRCVPVRGDVGGRAKVACQKRQAEPDEAGAGTEAKAKLGITRHASGDVAVRVAPGGETLSAKGCGKAAHVPRAVARKLHQDRKERRVGPPVRRQIQGVVHQCVRVAVGCKSVE
jgi:hypothetical protein